TLNKLIPLSHRKVAVDQRAAVFHPGCEPWVPYPRRAVCAGGGEQLAVRAECHPPDGSVGLCAIPGMPGQGWADLSPVIHLPSRRGAVGAGGGEQPTARAERDIQYFVGIAGKGLAVRLPGRHVPQPHGFIGASRGEQRTVRAERDVLYFVGVAGEGLAVRL